jgi:hypothetical protein
MTRGDDVAQSQTQLIQSGAGRSHLLGLTAKC